MFTFDEDISVQPTPLLDIEYSLPPAFEADNLFYMSTAITNSGYGTAMNVNLESGQPELTCYNEFGNPVSCGNYDINILGEYMEDQYQSGNISINFGNISPSTTKVGYWEFLSDFNGRITGFSADYTHSDVLGGSSTSLINSISTNILYRMIGYKGYGNSSIYGNNSEVTHLIAIDSTFDLLPEYIINSSNGQRFNLSGEQATITHPGTLAEPFISFEITNEEGWIFTFINNPFGNNKTIDEIINNTGLILDKSQYWQDSSQIKIIDYAINNANYTVTFKDPLLPDIALYKSAFSWLPTYPTESNPINFNINVFNNSDQPSSETNLRLYLFSQNNKKMMSSILVSSIDQLGNIQINFPLSSDSLVWGWNNLELILDEDSLLFDSNRTNNSINFEIFKNRYPVLSGDTTITVTVDSLFEYSIIAIDPDIQLGDSLKYKIINGPAWVSIDSISGLMSGMSYETGVFTVTVEVSDSFNGFDIQNYYVDVHGIEILLNLKVFLEGPYFNGHMTPFLNVFGYLPLEQPYERSPWNYSGNESIDLFTSFNIIDWVLIDIIHFTEGFNYDIIGRKAAFLNFDGTVTDLDGVSYLKIDVADTSHMSLCINHRNHIKIYSSFELTNNDGVYYYNFTSNPDSTIGGIHSLTEVAPGIWGMLSGNGNGDGIIDNKDKNEIWLIEKGSSGYKSGDYNMDSQVDTDDKLVKWKPNTGKGCILPD